MLSAWDESLGEETLGGSIVAMQAGNWQPQAREASVTIKVQPELQNTAGEGFRNRCRTGSHLGFLVSTHTGQGLARGTVSDPTANEANSALKVHICVRTGKNA